MVDSPAFSGHADARASPARRSYASLESLGLVDGCSWLGNANRGLRREDEDQLAADARAAGFPTTAAEGLSDIVGRQPRRVTRLFRRLRAVHSSPPPGVAARGEGILLRRFRPHVAGTRPGVAPAAEILRRIGGGGAEGLGRVPGPARVVEEGAGEGHHIGFA